MKKLLPLLSLFISFNALGVNILDYYDDFTIGDFTYRVPYTWSATGAFKIYEDYASIRVADGVKLSGHVIVPEYVEIEGKPRKINELLTTGFANQTEITEITFPESIYTFSYGQFDNCSSLRTFTVPHLVEFLPQFTGCTSLSELIIPADTYRENPRMVSVSYDCFEDCPITTLKFGRDLSTRWYEFDKDKCVFPHLENLEILEGVTVIGQGIFTSNKSLTKITLPSTVREILEYGFYDCNISEIDLKNTAIIGKYAFTGNPLTETFTIPGTVRTIGDYAFADCANVKELIVAPYAYNPLYDLIESEEDYSAFDMGNYFNNTNIIKASIHRLVTNSSHSYLCMFPLMEEIELGDEVTELPYNFLNGTQIKDLKLPRNLKTIHENALPPSLTFLSIPPSVTRLEDYSINCTNLYELVLEDGDEDIYIGKRGVAAPIYGMFYPCKNLFRVYIGRNIVYDRHVSNATPDEVQSQQLYSPFRNLNHLIRVFVSPYVTKMDPDMFVDNKYTSGSCVDRIGMPQGININSSTNRVIYPRDAEILPGQIVYDKDFTKLYWVDYAYEGHIEFPETLVEVGDYAARNCSQATFSEFPQSLERIGDYAFDGCYKLTFDNLVFPESIKALGTYCLNGAKVSNSIVFPEGLESVSAFVVGTVPNMIYNAVDAVNPTKERICWPSRTVTIGGAVKSLPAYFLHENGSLSIESRSITPPVCNTNSLNISNKTKCELHVPSEAVSYYQTAAQWKDFKNVFADVSGIDSPAIDESEDFEEGELYNLQGIKVTEEHPAPGIYLRRTSTGVEKIRR